MTIGDRVAVKKLTQKTHPFFFQKPTCKKAVKPTNKTLFTFPLKNLLSKK